MNHRIPLLGLILAVSLAGVARAQNAAAPAAHATTIATVNPGRVFDEMQERKDLSARLEEERQRLAAEEKNRRDELKKLQSERDTFKAGSAQFEEANTKLRQAAIEFEAWGKISQQDIERRRKQQMKMLFDHIGEGVAEIAQKRSIGLVLYASDAIDITSDVIAAVDAKYKQVAPTPAP